MRRFLPLTLVLALLPAASASATPTQTVRSYYAALNLERQPLAYSLLSNSAKRQLGPYSRFLRGFRRTYLVRTSTVRRSGSRVFVRGKACDNTTPNSRGNSILTRFSGTWGVVRSSSAVGGYKMTSPRITATSQRIFECE